MKWLTLLVIVAIVCISVYAFNFGGGGTILGILFLGVYFISYFIIGYIVVASIFVKKFFKNNLPYIVIYLMFALPATIDSLGRYWRIIDFKF